MKFKKLMCVAYAALFCCLNIFNVGVSALFGAAHFNLGKKIIEKSGIELSKGEEEAFLSGIVYADIGRFKFDKETRINSDSDEFVREIKNQAKTPEEKWFARGFEVHVFQDKKTKDFLKEIFGNSYSNYFEYATNCGILDSYFLKKSGILYNEFLDKFNFKQIADVCDDEIMGAMSKMTNIPKDGLEKFVTDTLKKYSDYSEKNNLLIYSKLIQDTYKSLECKIDLDSDKIQEQAGNLLGTFIIVSELVGEKYEISKELLSRIEKKSDDFANLCACECGFMQ